MVFSLAQLTQSRKMGRDMRSKLVASTALLHGPPGRPALHHPLRRPNAPTRTYIRLSHIRHHKTSKRQHPKHPQTPSAHSSIDKQACCSVHGCSVCWLSWEGYHAHP